MFGNANVAIPWVVVESLGGGLPGTRSQQSKKLAAIMEPGHDMSRASLGELQQDLQVLNQDLQSRREALVRELQEVDEQLLARPGGEEASSHAIGVSAGPATHHHQPDSG